MLDPRSASPAAPQAAEASTAPSSQGADRSTGTRNAVVRARTGLVMKTYTYLPTPADPFFTTITLVGGRVSELERVRKF